MTNNVTFKSIPTLKNGKRHGSKLPISSPTIIIFMADISTSNCRRSAKMSEGWRVEGRGWMLCKRTVFWGSFDSVIWERTWHSILRLDIDFAIQWRRKRVAGETPFLISLLKLKLLFCYPLRHNTLFLYEWIHCGAIYIHVAKRTLFVPFDFCPLLFLHPLFYSVTVVLRPDNKDSISFHHKTIFWDFYPSHGCHRVIRLVHHLLWDCLSVEGWWGAGLL